MVTDGDIRRALIQQQSLTIAVSEVMNATPTSAPAGTSKDELLAILNEKAIQHVPILDKDGILCGLETLKQLLKPELKDNWVVLMAGGFGTRLRPLTQSCPKPLLKIDQKPMLEIILDGFKANGFHRFVFCINYLGSMIQDYFGDGSSFDCEIIYVNEAEPLGTAGALSLLSFKPEETFFVMNADIMTRMNYSHLLDFHSQQNACATLCVRKHQYQIPYGVVASTENILTTINEKPTYDYFINAGIYLLEPDVLPWIEPNQACHMTDLLTKLSEEKFSVATFPIQDYWQDIGRPEDFHQAQRDYQEYFI